MSNRTKKIIVIVFAIVVLLSFVFMFIGGYRLGPDRMWIK